MKSIKTEYKNRIEYRDEKGNLHREDGPAVVWNNGDRDWIINGEYHREDGPAIECNNGDKWFFLNDVGYSEEQWRTEVAKIKLKLILEL
jgi:hypothetical protein